MGIGERPLSEAKPQGASIQQTVQGRGRTEATHLQGQAVVLRIHVANLHLQRNLLPGELLLLATAPEEGRVVVVRLQWTE